MEHIHDNRRIHTDGRDFPDNMNDEPMFAGYSIGRWVDEDGDGRYDALLVETRGFKGPRNYDVSGIPLHRDNQSIIRERIYLDKANPNLLHDEITTIDHALTRHWDGAAGLVARGRLRRGQCPCRHRRPGLFPELGRPAHADAQEPAAARPEVFQTNEGLTALASAPARDSRACLGDPAQRAPPRSSRSPGPSPVVTVACRSRARRAGAQFSLNTVFSRDLTASSVARVELAE
jgi:hypothetical protein